MREWGLAPLSQLKDNHTNPLLNTKRMTMTLRFFPILIALDPHSVEVTAQAWATQLPQGLTCTLPLRTAHRALSPENHLVFQDLQEPSVQQRSLTLR